MNPGATRRGGRVIALTLLALLAGCDHGGPQGGEMPPPEVTVEPATRGDVPIRLEYTGRAVGSREVEVRARVSGILLERRYQEGTEVREGQVLFRIDPEQYRATAAQARAELGVARARLEEARRQRDRIVPLFEKNAVSQRQRDEAVSQFEVAQADVEASRAKLRTAELDLGYTEVRAPISGLTSREALSEGSLVTAGTESSLLTRIVQTDPLYVEFSVPEDEAISMRRAGHERAEPLVVSLLLEDAPKAAVVPGQLTFIDTSIEQSSGTVRARATATNAGRRLIPGQFVRVRVEGIVRPDAVAVPRRAVMSSAKGNFVWVVGKGDVAEFRPVQLGGDTGSRALVEQGLAGDERIITDGVLKARPGAKVKPVAPAPPPGAPRVGATS